MVVEIFTWDEDSGGSPVNASSIRAMEAMIDFRRISYLLYLDSITKFTVTVILKFEYFECPNSKKILNPPHNVSKKVTMLIVYQF